MFPPTDKPRVFRLGIGVDLAEAFVRGLDDRTRADDPVSMARVRIFVNTQRLGRRISDVLSQGPARFHPKIAPVTTFGAHLVAPGQNNALTHRLHLAELLRTRMRAEPSYGPASSAFALANSLLALFEEISGEGVTPEALFSLDVGQDHAAHLGRNLAFVKIARDYFETLDFSDEAARQRRAAELQIAEWSTTTTPDPVLVVGSTGSRGTTAMIMDAVAKLPNGAVVLPGFDAHVPETLWAALGDGHRYEDHPQHRLAACLSRLDLKVEDVATWAGVETDAPRNRLISLALRPAPVTDAWLREGPDLGDPIAAMRDVALIEAASPREEALSIALELRAAAEQSLNAALVSPNRTLTRQVAAMLDRWGIVPDDSAGRPLGLLPPGQFLASLSVIMADRPSAAELLAILKHPLCHSGETGRDAHFLSRRALERALREDVELRLTPGLLNGVATDAAWGEWASGILSSGTSETASVGTWAQRLKTLAEHAGRGADPDGTGQLWDKEAGKAALALMDRLIMEGDAGGPLSGAEFSQTFLDLLAREDVRDALVVHPKIKIWGTLEARVQTADVVILAGLNEDVWPGAATADPWLNRKLRRDAGLLVPERRVGLQAHDFQQAAGAPRIALSRAKRDGDADTVPARWLNRITNLLSGLDGGEDALKAMRARGETRLAQARALDRMEIASPKATRPKPKPPLEARPRRLSVTQIQTLVRDPYAIYATKVLGLRALNALDAEPEARLRGILVHRVFEDFISQGVLTRERLIELAETAFSDMEEREVAALWVAAIRNWADDFVAAEVGRQSRATPIAFEKRGKMEFPHLNFTLSGEADRIDRADDGRLVIYDYKTGTVPTHKVMNRYDRQLLLEAVMAEEGAFDDVAPATVARVVHLKIGNDLGERDTPLEDLKDGDFRTQTVRAAFEALIAAYLDPDQGFLSRRMLQFEGDPREFDHLARLGEWSEADEAGS